jgi:hypothetical protein
MVGVSQIALSIGVLTGHLGGDVMPEDGGQSLQDLLALMLAASGVNGLLGRDANITSEQSKSRDTGGGGPGGGRLPCLLPFFLAVGAALAMSGCAQLDQATNGLGSVFKGLSARIGTDGSGGVAEVTVPPGVGVGVKFYPVVPGMSKLPRPAPELPILDTYPPEK